MLRHHILVLEDETADAHDLQATLQRFGFSPAIVSSAQEAVLHAQAIHPDLMLVDGNAGGDASGSAFQILGQVHTHLDIPLVFLLPYGDEGAMERAVARAESAQADGFILRPYHEQELVQTVKSVLREHKSARQRVQARTYWHALATITPDFLISADIAGNILYLNPAARRLFGVVEDLPNDLHLSNLHPAWATATVLGDGIETAVLDGIWRGEAALLAHDGREIPVSEVIFSHTGPDGKCEFLSFLAHDISELVRTEEALRSSEQMYRRIVETAPIGIWVVDAEYHVRLANPRVAQLLGYTVQEMIGTPLAAYFDGGPFESDTVTSYPSPGPHTYTLRCKDGTHLIALLDTSPVYDEQERQNGVMVTVLPK